MDLRLAEWLSGPTPSSIKTRQLIASKKAGDVPWHALDVQVTSTDMQVTSVDVQVMWVDMQATSVDIQVTSLDVQMMVSPRAQRSTGAAAVGSI